MTPDQMDALLDVFEQCRAVSYAHRQCLYHAEHRKSKLHEKCKLTKGVSSTCQSVDKRVRDLLMEATEKLTKLYKEAFDEGVPEATLDLMLYEGLPEIVFQHLYEEKAA